MLKKVVAANRRQALESEVPADVLSSLSGFENVKQFLQTSTNFRACLTTIELLPEAMRREELINIASRLASFNLRKLSDNRVQWKRLIAPYQQAYEKKDPLILRNRISPEQCERIIRRVLNDRQVEGLPKRPLKGIFDEARRNVHYVVLREDDELLEIFRSVIEEAEGYYGISMSRNAIEDMIFNFYRAGQGRMEIHSDETDMMELYLRKHAEAVTDRLVTTPPKCEDPKEKKIGPNEVPTSLPQASGIFTVLGFLRGTDGGIHYSGGRLTFPFGGDPETEPDGLVVEANTGDVVIFPGTRSHPHEVEYVRRPDASRGRPNDQDANEGVIVREKDQLRINFYTRVMPEIFTSETKPFI